jgi:aminoglycoside phosphotransferase (APT) family kinase protein
MTTLATSFGSLQHSRTRAARAPRARPVDHGDVPSEIAACLRAMELLAPGDVPRLTPLSASRDARVLRADLGWGSVCLKLAEAVPAGPVDTAVAERVDAEVRWLKLAQSAVPGCTPAVLGVLPSGGCFAMEHLEAGEFPTWQSRLAAGQVEPWVAAELGHLIGRLHGATARSPAVAQQFDARVAFRTLRIAQLFGSVGAAHPDCAGAVQRIAADLAATRAALVHGDLCPGNVLSGPRGPVLIDADCAHYGDPAFDVASMLAALLVRMAAHCRLRTEYAACWDAFHRSYAVHVTWEMTERAEARAAALIPALALAAIESDPGCGLDSASDEGRRARDAARQLLLAPTARPDGLRDAWLDALAG